MTPRSARRRVPVVTWSLRRRLNAALAVAAAVVLLELLVGVVVAFDVRQARERVVGSIVLDSAGEAYYRAVLDQEAGVRGYLLTRDQAFLAAYATGSADAARSEAVLRRGLAGEPAPLGELDGLVAAQARWDDRYAKPAVQAVRTGRQPPPAALGRQLFDRVRSDYAQFAGTLSERRGDAVHALNQANALLLTLLLIGIVLVVIAMSLLALALRRWVTRPLDRLGAEVQTVSAGDYQHPVYVAGPTEIAQVSADVDAMRREIVDRLDDATRLRARAEEQAEQLNGQAEELRRSNTELEQLAYVASHDLQEPLRKVASFTQLLGQRYHGQLDERADQYIEYATDGAKRMQQLINELLEFSRVGRVGPPPAAVDCEVAFRDALRNLSVRLDETGAEVTADPLPVVVGDRALLTQVFQNLVDNALKFTEREHPHVHLSCERDGPEWLFGCQDDGIGIEAAHADKVFVIFQRLHGRDRYDGTGIGLALCKKIVEYHGGRIWLGESQSGTLVRWTLPVAVEDPMP